MSDSSSDSYGPSRKKRETADVWTTGTVPAPATFHPLPSFRTVSQRVDPNTQFIMANPPGPFPGAMPGVPYDVPLSSIVPFSGTIGDVAQHIDSYVAPPPPLQPPQLPGIAPVPHVNLMEATRSPYRAQPYAYYSPIPPMAATPVVAAPPFGSVSSGYIQGRTLPETGNTVDGFQPPPQPQPYDYTRRSQPTAPIEFTATQRTDLLTQEQYEERLPLVRGSGVGRTFREPSKPPRVGHRYLMCVLNLENATEADICYTPWSPSEMRTMRRLIRITRSRNKNVVTAHCQILDVDDENDSADGAFIGNNDDSYTGQRHSSGGREMTRDGTINQTGGSTDTMDVSCLMCLWDSKVGSYDSETIVSSNEKEEARLDKQFFVTSVEVVKLVSFLACLPTDTNNKEVRKENGRIRSNLRPFWCEQPINSKRLIHDSQASETDSGKTNASLKSEMACRIMEYRTNKPRSFDKDVRILEWANLGPALKRAMRRYYAEVPL